MASKLLQLRIFFYLPLLIGACSNKESNENTILIKFENSHFEYDSYEGIVSLLEISSNETKPIKIVNGTTYLEKLPFGNYALSYQNIYAEPMIHTFNVGSLSSRIVIDRSKHYFFYEDFKLKTTTIAKGDTLIIGVLNFTKKKYIKIWKESERYFASFPKLTNSGIVEEDSYCKKEVTDYLDLFKTYEVELKKINAVQSSCYHNEIDYFFILNNDTTIYNLNSCSWNGLKKLYSSLNKI